ncbi:hypothetical protein PV325_004853 [Microctonus aethiopoides]|uniref:Uncharacterized protein n=1 Tax=Microctonus aethiopoides TaxID=144406 RepID=A0AA39EVF8_9HYME|nr:hypothetical protein PV325_004853 [Microctonus aethiopoides]KAK0157544.1 hypothetical protein PV328_011273 [Microctonus aethiopoides]
MSLLCCQRRRSFFISGLLSWNTIAVQQNPTTHSESSPLLRVAYFFKLHNSFKAFKFNRQTTMTPRIKNVELCLVNVCDVCRLIGIIEKDKPVWEFLVERYKRI